MSPKISPIPAHPQGESFLTAPEGRVLLPASIPVDTIGRRIQVEWDPDAPVTPLGQLVFFCQFLAAGGLYSKWVAECPLRYTSPNAPNIRDVLGTWALGCLSGAWRYATSPPCAETRSIPKVWEWRSGASRSCWSISVPK